MVTASCPALMVVAPASGQGKTTVTAALARLQARQGRRVRVFKCGPDFLDPHWHQLASGQPVHNLDLWLNGEPDVRARLHDAATHSDLILIEGVMGLFDGEPSAADLALKLGIPVLAVIDASAMAGTFGALVHGLRHYRPGLPWAGVLANRVASEGHEKMLRASVRRDDLGAAPEGLDAGWLSGLRRDAGFALPERHLGLTVAAELPDAMARLDALADAMASTPLGQLDAAGWQRWAVGFEPVVTKPVLQRLRGRCVAVARDAAFCFIYPANLDTLRALGAELVFFSPLADEPVPDCDAVWLPGGYPELHTPALVNGTCCRASLAAHIAAGRPVWAECGGMMPLFDGLTLTGGERLPMWGLLPGEVVMQPRLAGLGPQRWDTAQGELRGHSFHFSLTTSSLSPLAQTVPGSKFGRAEAVHGLGSVRASYFHAWFASNPEAAAQLFLPEVAVSAAPGRPKQARAPLGGSEGHAVPSVGASSALPGPQRIVCLTEETAEWLYLLGQEARIVGISGYTVRPRRAREEKPKVSAFLNAKIDRILALRPDCVFGFSDLQADIAAALIRAGVPVTVFNQRSVEEIFSMLFQVAAMVGCADEGQARIAQMRQRLHAIRAEVAALVASGQRRPRVFFEEWDEPAISGIRWVSELLGIAGGDDIFPERALMPLGKDRIIADGAEIVRRAPDIVIGSWCGKKFRPDKVAARAGWQEVPAVKTGQLFEIKSADILQPGPAALTDGIEQMHRIVVQWMKHVAPTLGTACGSLPREGALPALGRPGGGDMA